MDEVVGTGRDVGVVLLLSDPLGEAAGGAVLGDEGEVEEDRAVSLCRRRATRPGRAARALAFRSRRPLGSAVARPASQVTAALRHAPSTSAHGSPGTKFAPLASCGVNGVIEAAEDRCPAEGSARVAPAAPVSIAHTVMYT